MTPIDYMLAGAVVLASAVVGTFFMKFWRHTGDRFFLFFALAFLIEGLNRIALTLLGADEYDPIFYGVRLMSYGLILLAIWHKNRDRSKRD